MTLALAHVKTMRNGCTERVEGGVPAREGGQGGNSETRARWRAGSRRRCEEVSGVGVVTDQIEAATVVAELEALAHLQRLRQAGRAEPTPPYGEVAVRSILSHAAAHPYRSI
jgi:hypothetical protein